MSSQLALDMDLPPVVEMETGEDGIVWEESSVELPQLQNGLPGSNKYYQPKRVSTRHMRLCALAATGRFKNSELAELCGYTESHVSILLNRPQGKKIVREIQQGMVSRATEGAAEKIVATANEAVETMQHVMRSAKDEGDHTNARLAAKDFLDRTVGVKTNLPGERIGGGFAMTPEIASLLEKTLLECAEEAEEVAFVENTAELFRDREEEALLGE